MSHLINYAACPVCQSNDSKLLFTIEDHAVSHEQFPLWECQTCKLRFTQSVPCETAIQRYYQFTDYISHTNTKKGLINSLYHIIRSITLKQKVHLVKNCTHKQIGMHMDVGAGTGAFVHAMENAGWNTIGLEPDEKARERANKLFNVSVYPSSELFQLPANTYDAITLWHVLEHVHQLQETVAKLSELLSTNGKLIIAVPNYTSYDADQYGSFWAAYDVPRHLYHFSPLSMKLLLQKQGLKIVETRRMWFDSFYVSMLSEKYKGGLVVKGVFTGFVSNLKAVFQKDKCSSLIYIAEKQIILPDA